jgi:predicted TIM-barrel fold metal-dependent hydrolase
MKRIIILSAISAFALTVLYGQGQYKSKYPDITIVDVHFHPRGASDVTNLVKMSEVIQQKYGSNLAFWVSLNDPGNALAGMKTAGKNRILFATNEYNPHKGLSVTAGEVIAKVRNGYVGLKFWFGDPRRVLAEGERGITEIDDIRFEDFFSALERGNVLMASLHIADPNGPFDDRQTWMADPVYYWKQIRAFENVVAKYPKLTIIAAHGAWLVCQDAQIDYLRYMLSKYPNFYIDLAATFQYMPLVNRENLRDFFIVYQDRILYGTDGGRVPDNTIDSHADRYARTFAILETNQTVNGSFFGNQPVKGLDLPREVLEKIYYKNAVKLYPGLKEAMGLK